MNAMLHEMLETDDDGNILPASAIPFIDGGTEAFKGQTRVIIPGKLCRCRAYQKELKADFVGATSCFECSLETFPPQMHFPLCTIAETPRKPEHCIAYALFAINRGLSNPEADGIRHKFEEKFGSETKLNKDDPHHMKFIFEEASTRADMFQITGVSYMLTMGVVKHIIPAVASTNAVIAAACVNEAFKALSWCSQNLNSYFMYNGTTGVYTHTFEYGKQ